MRCDGRGSRISECNSEREETWLCPHSAGTTGGHRSRLGIVTRSTRESLQTDRCHSRLVLTGALEK